MLKSWWCKPPIYRAGRAAYTALGWLLTGIGAAFVALPAFEALGGVAPLGAGFARLVLLGLAALLAFFAWLGNFPAQKKAFVAPLALLALVGAEWALALTGCAFSTGLHPVNAIGVAFIALGAVRSVGAWEEPQ